MKFPLSIETTLYDAGCLSVLLPREIAKVELLLQRAGDEVDPDLRSGTQAYLAQLKAVLEAYQIAVASL